jgi:UDP-N-acetylmuramoyl-L-alanyl-D-glutamate--2,6-diaminopimelate ligase
MKLKKLLKDLSIIQVKGSKEVEITGICANSKCVAPGNLFIAKKGWSNDGVKYIPEAIQAGAAAILTDVYDPTLKEVVQIIHPEIKKMEALLASFYYQSPSTELFLAGLTGTNGKTTTSFILKHLLECQGLSCGLIGTIEYIMGEHRYRAPLTTPDVVSNQKMLREMVLQGCQAAIMEVTSHALDQGRVDHIEYDVALFTNLTLDHLDYHQTMENYGRAKQKLFHTLNQGKKSFPKVAIVNADDPWHTQMIEGCKAQIITYALERPADLRATHIQFHPEGTSFDLSFQGKTLPCKSNLSGRFNVYNALAAMAIALARHPDLAFVIAALASFRSVPGRLEPVENSLGLNIYVDFAHSDDALANVLECLNEITTGKIITVFGCGGDRDSSKRPKMASVSEAFSDFTIVTSDNPRSEDPVEIARQIVKGFSRPDSYLIELDRAAAIKQAIDRAHVGDVILIAGKGHETSQIFAHKITEFDDRKVAAQLCQQRVREKR